MRGATGFGAEVFIAALGLPLLPLLLLPVRPTAYGCEPAACMSTFGSISQWHGSGSKATSRQSPMPRGC